MSENDNTGAMTVSEAGRKGGRKVKEKYGIDHYREIGRKGGESTKALFGPAYYEAIGRKGGIAAHKKDRDS